MILIERVFKLCKDKLIGQGWDDLLKGHGPNIEQPTPAALATELARPGLPVKHRLGSLSDFASKLV